MDRMTSMATFVKVVEAGGFAAASRKLNMSPSTVTMQIQALEKRLGARLLNRSTRKISLTDVGKSYYERCVHILADADEADNVVQALHSTPRGALRINASVAVPSLLAPVIAEFTSLYPEVKLSVTMSDRMVDLVEEGIDLAIRTSSLPNSSLIVRRVGSFRMQVFGAPRYFATHGIPRKPSDLSSHNCLRYTFSPWGCDWLFDGPDGEEIVHVCGGNMESNSVDTLRLAAVSGQGLLMVPSFLVTEDIKSGGLVPVLQEFCRTEQQINAIYPDRHHLSAKVRSFLDLVTKHFRSAEVEFANGNGIHEPAVEELSFDRTMVTRLTPRVASRQFLPR
jgi:DNA-binding transcriptional LysR family regulator